MTTLDHTELNPCPFCGQQDVLVEQLDSDASVVICQGRVGEYSACLARGPVGVQESEDEDQPGRAAAIREWNLRTATASQARPQVLEEALRAARGDLHCARFIIARHLPGHHWLPGFDKGIRNIDSALGKPTESVTMDKLTITNTEWKAFNYEDYESGLFWLLVEAPDVDIDADDDGRTVGRYTGEFVRSAVLATVEQDHDGLPYFDAVDSVNFGRVPEDGVVTHYAEVKGPDFPSC